MHKIFKFDKEDIIPQKEQVFEVNGYPANKIPEKINNLVEESLDLFNEYAVPISIYAEISKPDIKKVIAGEGSNEVHFPLENIYPPADELILFALTLGDKVSEKIKAFFNNNDFAKGHMLDCVSSLAANNATSRLEVLTHKESKKLNKTLAYSPGYCGWHISGQKKLFEYLHPDKIGISLNNSFLMTPIKSVSGVLISGSKEIHNFKNNFSFCKLCREKNCMVRMKGI